MGDRTAIQVWSAVFVLFLMTGAFFVVPVAPQPATAFVSEMAAPTIAASNQTISDGDYIQYVVTVGLDTGIRRFDFSDVNATRMTVDITSTIWYFGSQSFTANYSYEDNMVLVPGLMGRPTDDTKTGEVDILTAYGVKHVNVFSHWDTGPYSDVLRTFLVPLDCLVYYKYFGNDTDGNHVVMTLDQTNIGWLQDVGHQYQENGFTYTVSEGVATITGYTGVGGAISIPAELPAATTTVTIYSGADDRHYYDHQTQTTFVGMRDLASADPLVAGDSSNEMGHNSRNQFSKYVIMRNLVWFDLTSLPDNAVIDSATLSLYVTDSSFDGGAAQRGMSICVPVAGYPSRPGVNADFDRERCGPAVSSLTSFTNNAYNDFLMPSPNITSGEWNAFYLRMKGDMDNVSPGNHDEIYNYISYYLGTAALQTHRPRLVITYHSYPVMNIGESAFSNQSAITSVEISDSITSIGSNAFQGCTGLTSVTIGSGVTTIGNNAFRDCTNLSSIRFVGLLEPTNVGLDWIINTDPNIRGHAYAASNFPAPGGVWNGLIMGAVVATPEISVPNAPTLSWWFAGASIVSLFWDSNGDGNSSITGYRVYRSNASDGVYSLIASPVFWYYNDTDVINGHTYWYKVSAVNAIGESANSSAISAMPLSVPDAPTGLIAVPGDTQVSLSWSTPADDGGQPIDYYVIYQYEVALPDHPTGNSTVITGLTNWQWYNFTVAAHNAVGIGAQTDLTSATPIGPPGAPNIVSATPGPSFVILSWIPYWNATDNPITGYKLYRSNASDGTFSLVSSPTALTYTDTGLTNGQDVWYKVSAINVYGEGPKSSGYMVTVGVKGMTSHDSGKGYSILVPSGWTVEEDVTLGGYHADTYISGPISHGIQTNVVVVTGADSSIRDTQSYLEAQVQATRAALEAEVGMDVVITGDLQYVEISNHSAVKFGWDIVGSGMHQQGVLIIDAEHMRYWSISCTESVDARSEFDLTFDVMIDGFAITSVPGLTSTDVLIIVVIVVIVGLALIGTLVYFLTRKKCPRCGKRVKKDWTACLNCGNQLGSLAPASCRYCGTKLESGWNICPNCGKEVGVRQTK
jgi:fibronectin type 3 domain-containing protein